MENIKEVKDFILEHKTAKIYLGADSQRIKKKRVKFVTVVVIHYEGHCGAKVFHEISYDTVKDAKLSRPFNRMMKEVQLLTDLYSQLEDVLYDREFEIHLDVSQDPKNGSSVAYQAAKGVIWGYIGVEPVCKPDAWCASTVADKYSK
jgi:predicted RNase H-related nuclease YkuK (DUF458 family)